MKNAACGLPILAVAAGPSAASGSPSGQSRPTRRVSAIACASGMSRQPNGGPMSTRYGGGRGAPGDATASVSTASPSSRVRGSAGRRRRASVAAGAGEAAVVVVDPDIGRRRRVRGAAQDHHLVVVSPARDGWRAPPRGRQPNPSRRSRTKIGCPRRSSAGFGGPPASCSQIFILPSGGPAASPAPARSMARAPKRVKASRRASSRRRGRLPLFRLRRLARRRAGPGASSSAAAAGPGGTRSSDAAPAEMSVDPLDDDRRDVLRLERESAVHPQHQRRRGDRRLGSRSPARGGHCNWSGRRSGRCSRRRSSASRRSGSPPRGHARPARAR